MRTSGHQCLHCNEKFDTIPLLMAHQTQRQHFGGHHWKVRRSTRLRRIPARLRDEDDEHYVDRSVGACELHLPHHECSDDEECVSEDEVSATSASVSETVLPDLDITSTTPSLSQSAQDNGSSATVRVRNQDPVPISSTPTWVQKLITEGYKGFSFNTDFSRFWCDCGHTPRLGALASGGRSNLMKHRKRRVCTYDGSQLRIGQLHNNSKLVQSKFRDLLLKSVIECNLPYKIVEQESFKKLLLSGTGREHLTIPGRRTISRDVSIHYSSIVDSLKKDIKSRSSRITVTFDIWSDRRARGFLGVTGHYFAQDLTLRCVVLAVEYLPKTVEGHSASRIYSCVSDTLKSFVGPRWKDALYCFVTDGASNVTSASQQLGKSRRCLQHSLQLLLKHFCIIQSEVSTAMACCNYLARLTKVSQKVRSAVGNIPAGVCTRWNSYLNSAMVVYNARAKFDEYVNSASCSSSIAPVLRCRIEFLAQKGYRILHDMVKFLKPLMDITIDEEGELYITSSLVIPRLLTAKRKMVTILNAAKNGCRSNGCIIDPDLVASWEPLFNDLWNSYLDGFIHDDMLLCATLLDARNGCGRELSVSLLSEAKTALQSHLLQKYDNLVEESDILDVDNVAAGPSVASRRNEALNTYILPQSAVARVFGVESTASDSSITREKAVEEELAFLFRAVNNSGMVGKWDKNPLDMFIKHSSKLKLSRSVALDVLSVPAGQAASERVFSIASRIYKYDRSSMSPQQVSEATFIKKNIRALGMN